LVGKGSVVPEGYMLGRNVIVHAQTGDEAYGKRKKIASGHDVGAARR
jgi:glucose-1-phosphate adenylyltransferase